MYNGIVVKVFLKHIYLDLDFSLVEYERKLFYHFTEEETVSGGKLFSQVYQGSLLYRIYGCLNPSKILIFLPYLSTF